MTLLYYDPLFLEHDTGDLHPESKYRLVPAARSVSQLSMHMGCRRPKWSAASHEDLELVHDREYIAAIARQCEAGGGQLDPDTTISKRSFEVATLAAGAALDAVRTLLSGDEKRAFCLSRPPGHHALANRAMGFCLFNNVALAARAAIERHDVDRVLIVDWDVHHGNGTQAMFWEDEQIGFLSIHRYPFYPGTGSDAETGTGRGLGSTRNVPVAFGTAPADYRDRFARALEEMATHMRPQLVLISAGFDAHRLDPIGSLDLEAEDFGLLTRMVVDVASEYSEGRIVSVLEGGYNSAALAECVDQHLHELLRTS